MFEVDASARPPWRRSRPTVQSTVCVSPVSGHPLTGASDGRISKARRVDADPVLDATERPLGEPGTTDCRAKSPEGEFSGFGCTRRSGHDGPHVAHGARHQAVLAWDAVSS